MAKNSIKDPSEIAQALEDSILEAKLHSPCQVRGSIPQFDLSEGQYELIRFIAEGLSNREIAARKVVTIKSTENSIARLAKKLNIKDLTTNSQRVLIAKKYFEMIGKV